MASKREKLKRAEDNVRAEYEKQVKKLSPYGYIAAGVAVIALLLCFCNFIYIWNNGKYYNSGTAFLPQNGTAGVEDPIASGWTFFVTFLSGNYKTYNYYIGNVFYDYAPNYTKTIAALTFIAMLLAIVTLFLSAFSALKNKPVLGMVSAGCSLLSGILFMVCFILPLTKEMHTLIVGDYYKAPSFCQGNPACSLKSLAILPALVMLGACAVSVYAAVKFIKIKKPSKND